MKHNSTRTSFAIAALAAISISGSPARADLTFGLTPSSALPGGTGAFEVTLTDNSGAFDVAAFTFDVAVPPSSGVTFTNADFNTSGPYIFAGNSLDQSFSLPLTTTSLPATELIGFDVANVGATAMGPGDVFDLGNLTYSVAPGTNLGPVAVTLANIGAGTSLSDALGNAIPFTPANSIITVGASSAVPEPGACALLAALAMSGFGAMRRRGHVR